MRAVLNKVRSRLGYDIADYLLTLDAIESELNSPRVKELEP